MIDTHRARKRFGQNFLHDRQVIQRIADSVAPSAEDHVVEIGPGKGALTDYLLSAARLDAVEVDRDLAAMLRERFAEQANFHLHEADALRFDFSALAIADRPLRVVGNLPYNISTPLIFHLLAQGHCISDMHFMLQKEVVERMAAGPGGKDYGPLSVMCQFDCRVSPLFTVSPGAFTPTPKVQSAVVRLQPRATAPVDADRRQLQRVVKAAFAQRRKTLKNALSELIDEAQLTALDIDPGTRAERLALADFATISRAIDWNSL